ncbi:MAG: peptidoglycan-binding domain-containing protein [Hyphomicrobium sp.]
MQRLANRAGSILGGAILASVALNLFALQDAATTRRGGQSTAQGEARPAWLEPASTSGAMLTPVVLNAAPDAAAPDDADVIRGVQRELNARNYEAGQPDGVAGIVTRAAVMAYEYDYNLPLTATPSEEVLSRIVLGSSATQATGKSAAVAPSPDAESLIRMVKQSLSALGYQTGRADGALTPDVQRAIREFETDQRLAETGRISGPLVSRLLRLQGQAPAAKPRAAKPAAPPAAKSAAVKPVTRVAPPRTAQKP